MLDEFSIELTPKSVDVIKRALAKSLSHVKSSHRIEGFARSVGFSTYAALNTALKTGEPVIRSIQWPPFRDYLESKDFNVTASPLYNAAAEAALDYVLQKTPRLHMFGFGYTEGHRKPDGTMPTLEERKQEFMSNRRSLARATDDFLRSYAFVCRLGEGRAINPDSGSYCFKHLVEDSPCTYPDGEKLGPAYVSNGALIAACIYAGFKHKEYSNNLNADFNVSKKNFRNFEKMVWKYRETKDESVFDAFGTEKIAKAA